MLRGLVGVAIWSGILGVYIAGFGWVEGVAAWAIALFFFLTVLNKGYARRRR